MKNTTRARMGFGPAYPWRFFLSPRWGGDLPARSASVHYAGHGQWRTTCEMLTTWAHSQAKMYLREKSKPYRSLKAAKQAAREWCK